MIRKAFGRRFLALLLALVFTMSLAVPSSAMGFDDLQTVIDMTGSVTEEAGDGPSYPEFEPGEETSPDNDEEIDDSLSDEEDASDPEEDDLEEKDPTSGEGSGLEDSEDSSELEPDSEESSDQEAPDEELPAAENSLLEDEPTVGASDSGRLCAVYWFRNRLCPSDGPGRR